jgi:hypothetical protein
LAPAIAGDGEVPKPQFALIAFGAELRSRAGDEPLVAAAAEGDILRSWCGADASLTDTAERVTG